MSLLDIFFGRKKESASVAKERLQIILAHERGSNALGEFEKSPSWLPQLQQELVDVVAKYIHIDKEALKIHIEKRDNLELLEINVTLPDKGENSVITKKTS
jgi:cell division topological specificity factor